MTVLGIETATTTCGAAVVTEDGVAAEAHLHVPRVHARRLTPLVEDVLTHAECLPDDGEAADRLAALDGIAVSMGPGSYTGLRIGVSTAKGWALAHDLPVSGIPSLEAHCARLLPFAAAGDVLCGLIDARRDEVYAAAYRVSEPGGASNASSPDLISHADTTALSVEDLPDWLGSISGRLWVVGDGGDKSRSVLCTAFAPSLSVLAPADLPPSAAAVAQRGRSRLLNGDADNLARLEPLYVKDVHATPAPSPF
jgi:tRNA threonylcarbamoyladenosine biosynthesis protein TsaB